MRWVEDFYSITGLWWGTAESGVDAVDRQRSDFLDRFAPGSVDVLELGCGYGSTAVAMAQSGRRVIGVELTSRLDYAPNEPLGQGSMQLLRADFFSVGFDQVFDVVCYWDGFGVGADEDQLRLLRRIADEWLAPDGIAIVEVFNPTAWAADNGLFEIREPGEDYPYRLGHRRQWLEETSTALDSWWEMGSDVVLTQLLRCYEPEEFARLAGRAGLSVVAMVDLASPADPPRMDRFCWSYVCVLSRQPPKAE